MSPLVGCPGPGEFLSGGCFARRDFFPGGLLPGSTFGRTFGRGIFVRGAVVRGVFCPGALARVDFCPEVLCPFPQVQCVYEPSRLFVPSIVA